MEKILKSLPFRLLIGVIFGIIIGQIANVSVMNIVVTFKYILNQIIVFSIPLIIIGFIAPSITRLGNNASKVLGIAVTLAYLSSFGAALFSAVAGYALIPNLSVNSSVANLKELPGLVFELSIPQIMPVMSALVLAVMLGLAATWTKAKDFTNLLDEFQKMILMIVTKLVIPLLPVFIFFTFCALSYEGTLTNQLPVFIEVVLIVMIGHFIWLTLLYGIGGIYSKKNPINVIRNYGSAYLTAVGTMSSAATLPVALKCARKAKPLRNDMVDFGIPMFSNIHLCGSVLTEVFFVMTVSKILYGQIPSLGTMILFCALLGVFAIGAPGVPGGTVMASLGLITGILGFDEMGTALMLTIFALQDSFGTACNIVGDGALTMILSGYMDRKEKKEKSPV